MIPLRGACPPAFPAPASPDIVVISALFPFSCRVPPVLQLILLLLFWSEYSVLVMLLWVVVTRCVLMVFDRSELQRPHEEPEDLFLKKEDFE